MTHLRLDNVQVRYGDHLAVDGATFGIASGELHAVVGASGAGKTSLLRAIAGFERVAAGRIEIANTVVDAADGSGWVPPEQRQVGVVFQDYALFPHLTVARNIAFGMKGHTMHAVNELLAEVGLDGFGGRMPGELSGGEQQRVALARALGASPRLLLLDEPFAHLDPARREELRASTRRVIRQHELAALMITHDAADALGMGDVIHVMHQGRIVQSGSPAECYDTPVDRMVAAALGVLQTLPCVIDDQADAQSPIGPVPLSTRPEPGVHRGDVLVRPEALALSPPQGNDGTSARVTDRMVRGADVDVALQLEGGESLVARVRRSDAPDGEHVRVRVAQPCAWLGAGS